MTWVAAVLNFLSSFITGLPKLIDGIRKWQRDSEIAESEVAKNQRNKEALARALEKK